ncbi:site-specific DNA-methyltransferase [Hymenobacter sp. BT175]|uniref:site-specific DNA-methyltransferase n=1 Tax=Hymenobacter translucens TaxID=2886507 RepID=UPI001D0DC66D|nr:site-specific DNA-methyltransferase [Hymenobacter translucens]MCC2548535.1 site-specific DNA-methyltransferase [Hymenobacter translucens]
MTLVLPFAEAPQNLAWGDTLSYPTTRTMRLYTHRIFNRYPARSINLVPRQLLHAYKQKNGPGRVLDPFLGSGTTAIEGLLAGFQTFGVEIDPFARLVAEVSTTPFTKSELVELRQYFSEIALSWPSTPVDEKLRPKLANIDYWFSEENFEHLLRLKHAIHQVCPSGPALNFFLIVLADVIRPCSRAERQTLKPYISKKFTKTPAPVGATFEKSFENYFTALSEFSEEMAGKAANFTWVGNDAVQFSTEKSVDLAITSPPYLNSIDYTRCIKIESAWLDCADDKVIKQVKNGQVGDESRKGKGVEIPVFIKPYLDELEALDQRRAGIAAHYFDDMRRNLQCVFDALRPGGCYHLIIGNSIMRGLEIPTHELTAKLGQEMGFEWSDYFRYKLKDHRLSIPRQNNTTGGKIEHEHVITLLKPIL